MVNGVSMLVDGAWLNLSKSHHHKNNGFVRKIAAIGLSKDENLT
jgi:hypothetical protein